MEHWDLLPPIVKAARGFVREVQVCYVCRAAVVELLEEHGHRANYKGWTREVLFVGYAEQCKEFMKTNTEAVVVLNWCLNVIKIDEKDTNNGII